MIGRWFVLAILSLQPASVGVQSPTGVSAALELSSGEFSVELQTDLDALLLGQVHRSADGRGLQAEFG